MSAIAHILWPAVLAISFVTLADKGFSAFGLKQREGWGKTKLESDLVYSRAVAAQERGKRLIVFIGDSRVEWGINPEVIQEYLIEHDVQDPEVFNLSYPGMNVRSIVQKLNEVEFYPDVLVIGYSHLSFYWSKLYVKERPQYLPLYDRLIGELKSLFYHHITLAGYSPREVLQFIKDRQPLPVGSWLSTIVVSPRGQARVTYGITEEEAIAYQRTFYRKMYEVSLSVEQFHALNESFRKELIPFRQHGTRLLLLRMPLAEWVLDLEKANEKLTCVEVAKTVDVPCLDGNDMPEALSARTFDGLHLAPPSDETFSEWLAKKLLTAPHREALSL
jgi:hypothetical protein